MENNSEKKCFINLGKNNIAKTDLIRNFLLGNPTLYGIKICGNRPGDSGVMIGQKKTDKQRLQLCIYILAWEPSAAKVTKSYSRLMYPLLNDFTGKLNLEYQNLAMNIPVR